MRLIDADRLKEVFSRNVAGGNTYFDLIDNTPTAEAISKDQYEARLKAERKKIAEDVDDKMGYMGSCLNERNIILGIITGKRETLDSLCSTCKLESCVSNGTAIPKSDYENRLKADMVAMLTEIQLEIEELDSMVIYDGDAIGSIGIPIFSTNYIRKKKVNNIIQQKINELKENSEKQKNRKCACYDCKHFDRKGMSHCTIHEDSYGDTRCFDYKENKE